MKKSKLKLWSPIKIECEAPYENPWDEVSRYRELNRSEMLECKNAVNEAMRQLTEPEEKRGLMAYYEGSRIVDNKVISAFPAVDEKDGTLMCVLECECSEELSDTEIGELGEWWADHCKNFYGDAFINHGIPTEKFGEIFVHLWFNEKNWSICQEYIQ